MGHLLLAHSGALSSNPACDWRGICHVLGFRVLGRLLLKHREAPFFKTSFISNKLLFWSYLPLLPLSPSLQNSGGEEKGVISWGPPPISARIRLATGNYNTKLTVISAGWIGWVPTSSKVVSKIPVTSVNRIAKKQDQLRNIHARGLLLQNFLW